LNELLACTTSIAMPRGANSSRHHRRAKEAALVAEAIDSRSAARRRWTGE